MQPPENPASVNSVSPIYPKNDQLDERKRCTAAQPHILLVGASIRAAAQSAKNAGFRVTGIDSFGDFDTRKLCDRFATFGELSSRTPAEFDDWVKQSAANECLQVGGVTAEGARVIEQLTRLLRLLGATDRMVREMTCTDWLRETADVSGISFPDSYRHDQFVLNEATTATSLSSSKWIRKASWADAGPSSGGLGVRWATPDLADDSNRDLWQRFTEGRSFGASYYSDGESAYLLGVCRSSVHRIGDRPFVYAGSFGPIGLHSSMEYQLAELGQVIVDRSQLTGVFGVDVIIDRSDQVTLLEINPRWTASSELIEKDLIRRGCCLPAGTLLGTALRSISTEQLKSAIEPTSGNRETVFWKRIVYARGDGRFRHASLPVAVSQGLGPLQFGKLCVEIADVPHDGHMIAKHDPILTVIFTLKNPSQPKLDLPWHDARKVIRSLQQSIYSPRSSANE